MGVRRTGRRVDENKRRDDVNYDWRCRVQSLKRNKKNEFKKCTRACILTEPESRRKNYSFIRMFSAHVNSEKTEFTGISRYFLMYADVIFKRTLRTNWKRSFCFFLCLQVSDVRNQPDITRRRARHTVFFDEYKGKNRVYLTHRACATMAIVFVQTVCFGVPEPTPWTVRTECPSRFVRVR